jgi:uncharacterized protein
VKRLFNWAERLVRRPFTDEVGHKGAFERIARAPAHAVRRLSLTLPHWPHWKKPLRIVFVADFHAGSYSGDVARLTAIMAEAQGHHPDLVLYGGDYMNMAPVGGGRIAPRVIAGLLGRIEAPLGRFAVLGNHDYDYGAAEIAAAIRDRGITVLDDELRALSHEGATFDLLGIPDAHSDRDAAQSVIRGLSPQCPTLILTHDPHWFRYVRAPAHMMLSGHTHGGQIRLPYFGAFINMSRAPLRWSYGHVVENGRHLFVTAGIGTSAIPLRIGAPPDYAVIEINGSP